MAICLCERLTFDKLFRISDPKRVYRSFTVRGPPLEIDSYQDAVYYSFNFKSNPSTTGLRHRGYIKFFKPLRKSPKDVPLQHLDCLVDCMCPDFRYRWAWANKQRGSSRVGPDSLNQAWNKAPKITNPSGRPGLCKHILAARQYIYGLLSSFPGDEPDTAEKLNKLTKLATKRWTDFEGAMQAARDREQQLGIRRRQRNLGLIKPEPMKPVTPTKPVAPKKPEPKKPVPGKAEPLPKKPTPGPIRRIQPEPLPPPEPKKAKPTPKPTGGLAIPPGQRGRGFPPLSTKTGGKPKRVLGNRVVKGMIPGQVPGTWESLKSEHVVNATGENNMSTLKDAIKLVEEMELDQLAAQHGEPDGDEFGAPAGGLDDMGTLDEPMEPPVSDAAIGADTEGETALGLLRQMKDLLTQLVVAVAPEAMPGAEGAEGGEMMDVDAMAAGAGPAIGAEGGEGAEGGMPPEPPSEEGEAPEGGGEGGGEANEFEPEEGEEEEGETRPAPKKAKKEKGDEE